MPTATLADIVLRGFSPYGNPMRLLSTSDGFKWQVQATPTGWTEAGPAEDFETPQQARDWLIEKGGKLE